MPRMISPRAQIFSRDGYAIEAARVREKANIVNDNALREQLIDLARHYSFLAGLATLADRNRRDGDNR